MALALFVVSAAPAQEPATPKAVIVDDGDFDLVKEDDGSWKATVGLTNTTVNEIPLTGAKSRNARDTGCVVDPAKDKLPPQRRTRRLR